MAAFCRQCSLAWFGVDYGELKPSAKEIEESGPLPEGYGYAALCEGCGFTVVNEKGECIATECMERLADSHAKYKAL